jgi:ribA/ribD-fused uncharacterized protein
MTNFKSSEKTEDSLLQANVINRFNNENKFLSNFQASTFFYKGKKYASVEHAYQALKTLDPDEHEKVRNAVSPSQAKKFGKSLTLREDWDLVKSTIMLELLRLKFQNPFLRMKLIATGNAILIEGVTWHDTFWGVCNCPKHNGEGQNVLGKLLMQVREEVKIEDQSDQIADDFSVSNPN